MVAWGLILAMVLSDSLSLLAEIIGILPQYWVIIISSPTVLVIADAWWFLVDWPQNYTYRWAALVAFLTAILTAFLWTGGFVSLWGFAMLAVPLVYLFSGVVYGVVGIAGLVCGISLMLPRRRGSRTSLTTGSD